MLPLPVLKRIQAEMLCLPGAGASIPGSFHRSSDFIAIQDVAIACVRSLLGVPEDYEVLLLQGGARLQFSMTAANLLKARRSQAAQYVLTGSWGKYAADEVKEGPVEVIYDAKASNYDRLPEPGELEDRRRRILCSYYQQ
ncbi:MAG: hypothetical protein U0892_05960 [Pirellulales bacterium]